MPTLQYDNYIFDFDGTIVTLDVNWGRLRQSIAEEFMSEEEHASSLGLHELVKAITDRFGATKRDQIYEIIRKHEQPNDKVRYSVNSDTVAFIEGLREFYIVSNNLRSTINTVLDEMHLSSKCKYVIAYDDVCSPKPNVEPFRLLKDKVNLQGKNLYVGDKATDKRFAEMCCIDFKWVGEIK